MAVYLGTNCARANLDWVHTLKAGEDEAWSRRLRFFLNSLSSEYVLLLLEDFFFDRALSSAQVKAQVQLLDALQGVSLRLFPDPPADYFRDGTGVVHGGANYRVSLQAAIWKRTVLLELLVDEESPWEFEWRGSRRSRNMPGFYCVREAVVHYRHVVERGEWFWRAARFYAAQGIGCDLDARPVMGPLKACRKLAAKCGRRLITRLHSRWLCLTRPEKMPAEKLPRAD